jgi:hypothetical protein
VKPTVHVEVVLATSDVGALVVKVTAEVGAAVVSDGAVPVGLAPAVSFDVATERVERASALPLSTPTVSVAAVDFASAQVLDPLFARVMTMTPVSLVSEAVAAQSVTNADGASRTTIGEVVRVENPVGYVRVIEPPGPSAPVAEVVNPHVHVEAAAMTREVGAVVVTETADTEVGVIVSPDEGATAVVSAEVATEKLAGP